MFVYYDMNNTTIQNSGVNLQLPKEKQVVQQAIVNLYVGLNKSTEKGIFNLKEAGQLSRDLELVSQIIEQVMKLYEPIQDSNK